jgi:hypothetical protein
METAPTLGVDIVRYTVLLQTLTDLLASISRRKVLGQCHKKPEPIQRTSNLMRPMSHAYKAIGHLHFLTHHRLDIIFLLHTFVKHRPSMAIANDITLHKSLQSPRLSKVG